MKKNIKYILLASSLALSSTILLSSPKNHDIFAIFSMGSTIWKHVSGIDATCQKCGIKEYWTNCNGLTVTEKPDSQEIEELKLSDSQINDILSNENDERILPKTEHSFYDGYSVNTIIGTKSHKCSVCNTEEETLIEESDISSKGADWGICSYFGGNGSATNKGSLGEFPEYNDLVGCKSSWFSNADGSVIDINLPKTNFSLFDSVSFVFHTNSKSANNTLYGFGLTDSGDDLIPRMFSGTNDKYVLTCKYESSSNTIKATIQSSSLRAATFICNDSNVINGNKSLNLKSKMGAYRYLVLDSVLINRKSSLIKNITVDNFVEYKYLMDTTNGASVSYGQDDIKNCLTWQGSSGQRTYISLPKIAFGVYDKVVFNLYANGGTSWSDKIGLDENQSSTISSRDNHSLTIYKEGATNKYYASLKLTYGNTTPTFVSEITDQDILNGTKSFKLYFSGGQWHNFSLLSICANPDE